MLTTNRSLAVDNSAPFNDLNRLLKAVQCFYPQTLIVGAIYVYSAF